MAKKKELRDKKEAFRELLKQPELWFVYCHNDDDIGAEIALYNEPVRVAIVTQMVDAAEIVWPKQYAVFPSEERLQEAYASYSQIESLEDFKRRLLNWTEVVYAEMPHKLFSSQVEALAFYVDHLHDVSDHHCRMCGEATSRWRLAQSKLEELRKRE